MRDGVSLRYIVLDIWERYGYTPQEWDGIDKQTQLEMIAKRQLEVRHEEWIKEQNTN